MFKLLLEPVVEEHGQDSLNGRRLQCAEIDNMFPTEKGRYKVRYSTLVIAVRVQKAPAPSTVFNCTERQVWQGLHNECYCNTP
jgi:hypothetical protein